MRDSNRRAIRKWSLAAGAALLAAGALLPATAEAGESRGSHRTLRPKPDGAPPSGHRAPSPPSGHRAPSQSPAGWDPEATPLAPWCSVSALDLAAACEDPSTTFSCGQATIPCIEPTGGLALAAAGTGLRNSGQGVISLAGAPASSRLVAAWLFWGTITRYPETTTSRTVLFNGFPVTGEAIGASEEPCWDEEVEASRRGDGGPSYPAAFVLFAAEVTYLLDGEVSGDFPVTVFGSMLATREDPWYGPPGDPPPFDAGDLSEGASLAMIYSHPDVEPDSLVALHSGPVEMREDKEFLHPIPILPPATRYHSTRLGGDGQVRNQEGAVGGYRTWISFDPSDWTLIQGPGSAIDVTLDWQGLDGGVNGLWDTRTTFIPGALVTPAQEDWNAYRLRYETRLPEVGVEDPWQDCVVPAVHGLWAGSMSWDWIVD